MITFSVAFNGDAFEKSIIEQLKKDFRTKLSRAGLSNISIKFVKKGGELSFVLSGDDADLEKAQKVLGAK